MTTATPKPGDKVRVTYEGVVSPVDGQAFRTDKGFERSLTDAVSVEVIEPADDPSKDPIGTVRVSAGHYSKHANSVRVVRSQTEWNGTPWVRFSGTSAKDRYTNAEVTGWPKQSLADVARVFGHPDVEPRPRVLRDAENDLWFELSPGRFTYGYTHDDAVRRRGDSSAYYRDFTEDRIKEDVGGDVKDVTNEPR